MQSFNRVGAHPAHRCIVVAPEGLDVVIDPGVGAGVAGVSCDGRQVGLLPPVQVGAELIICCLCACVALCPHAYSTGAAS